MTPVTLPLLAHSTLAVPLPALTLQLLKATLQVPFAGQSTLAVTGAYLVLVVPEKFLTVMPESVAVEGYSEQ